MRIFKFKSLIKYLISLILLILLLGQMDVSALLQKSGDFNIWLLLLAVILIIGQILFLNLRWHCYMNAGKQDISFRTSSLINIAGYFANILFITSVGGVIAKSGLAVKQGLSVTRAVFSTLLDRFMTLFSLIVFSSIGLVFLYNVIDPKLMIVLSLSVSGVISIVGLFLLILRSGILKDYILSSRKRSRIVVILRDYVEDYNLMAKTAVYSLVAQACFILSVYVLSLGFDSNVGTFEFLALMPILALVSSLPISFGGWGVREGAFIYGLGLIGFSMENAFMLSVQVGLVTLFAPFFVAIPYLLKEDLRKFLLSGGRVVG